MMIKKSRLNISLKCTALGLLMFVLAGVSPAQAEWEWEVIPYLWGPDLTGDVFVDDTAVASTTAEFSDLIKKLDIGALVHFEGRQDRWGFFVDLTYLKLSDDQTINGHPQVGDGTEVDVEIDQLLWEAGAAVHVLGENGGLDIIFGARILDLTLDVDFDFPVASDTSLSKDLSWVDGFAGLRYKGKIGERWLWWARADAGTGDTDLSWQGIAGLGVELGETGRHTLMFGYRHLVFEGEEDDDTLRSLDLEFSGPLVGWRFGF